MFFEKSLLDLYTITEKFRRTKLKYAKLQKKALKTQELKFYKKLIQRNMLTQQISALKTTYDFNLMS